MDAATERLYYDNAYLTHFEGRVLVCQPDGELFRVLLDRSAFYPTSGGQPFDTGMLGDARVVDVNVENDQVWHHVTKALTAGNTVSGVIDWQRRLDHMQQHAGDHLIAGALHRMLGGVTIGLHTGEDVSTIDVAMPGGETHLSPEWLEKIERDVNEKIQQDVPIRCWFPEEAELAVLPLRKKPTVSHHVRVVAIGTDEMVACGGTHPSSAGQIGLVKILSATPARGKMRVAFLAGMRAIAHYNRCFRSAHEAAEMISSNLEGLPQGVAAQLERLYKAEKELAALKREHLIAGIPAMLEKAQVLTDGTKLVSGFVEADGQLLRELVSQIIAHPGMIALMGARSGDQALYVFGRAADVQADMGKLMRAAVLPHGGKGGGKPDFAQGGGSPEILDAACRALLTGNQ